MFPIRTSYPAPNVVRFGLYDRLLLRLSEALNGYIERREDRIFERVTRD